MFSLFHSTVCLCLYSLHQDCIFISFLMSLNILINAILSFRACCNKVPGFWRRYIVWTVHDCVWGWDWGLWGYHGGRVSLCRHFVSPLSHGCSMLWLLLPTLDPRKVRWLWGPWSSVSAGRWVTQRNGDDSEESLEGQREWARRTLGWTNRGPPRGAEVGWEEEGLLQTGCSRIHRRTFYWS